MELKSNIQNLAENTKLMKAGTLITYEEALHELVSYTETLSQKQ